MRLRFLLAALEISILGLTAMDISATSRTDPFLAGRTGGSEIRDEVDPADQQACFSMGQISLTYKSGEVGPPNVGLRITDPRGRRIGYDLRTDQAWQELPLAQGFFDCDENEENAERKHCAGHIQICGPVSGTYKLELLPAKKGRYSIRVSSTSEERPGKLGFYSTGSCARLNGKVKITPKILFLKYSREAGAQLKLARGNQRVAAWRRLKPKIPRNRNLAATKNPGAGSQ